MSLIKNLIYLILLSAIIFFCFINRQDVNIHIIPNKIDLELPIFILIMIIAILGLIIGKLSGLARKIKYMFEIRQLNSQILNLKETISKNQINGVNND